MTEQTASRVHKTMGLDHADFWRVAPALMRGYSWEKVSPTLLRGERDGGRVALHLGPETRRRIAMFELPNTELTIEFTGLGEQTRREFMENFDRRFRRGGG